MDFIPLSRGRNIAALFGNSFDHNPASDMIEPSYTVNVVR